MIHVLKDQINITGTLDEMVELHTWICLYRSIVFHTKRKLKITHTHTHTHTQRIYQTLLAQAVTNRWSHTVDNFTWSEVPHFSHFLTSPHYPIGRAPAAPHPLLLSLKILQKLAVNADTVGDWQTSHLYHINTSRGEGGGVFIKGRF